jgi:DNA-binding transcriptional LysR family regulator
MASNPKHIGPLPLTALRAFDAVGTTGGVRAAAEALDVSPTGVPRHISNSEKRLGIALVRTKGRNHALTEAGAKFHAQITRALAIIADATDEMTKPARAPLRICRTPDLAVMRLPPRLPELESGLGKFAIPLRPTPAPPTPVCRSPISAAPAPWSPSTWSRSAAVRRRTSRGRSGRSPAPPNSG